MSGGSRVKLTGVSGTHYSREGALHGHTWHITAWWPFQSEIGAEQRRQELVGYIQVFDHSILPDAIAWGEDLAEQIGLGLDACAVDVSRPLEGIYAKWVRN